MRRLRSFSRFFRRFAEPERGFFFLCVSLPVRGDGSVGGLASQFKQLGPFFSPLRGTREGLPLRPPSTHEVGCVGAPVLGGLAPQRDGHAGAGAGRDAVFCDAARVAAQQ